jgi:hypothetical protein
MSTEQKPKLSLPRKRNWWAWGMGTLLGLALLVNGAMAWKVLGHLSEICLKLGGAPYYIGCTYRDATAPAPQRAVRPSSARRIAP